MREMKNGLQHGMKDRKMGAHFSKGTQNTPVIRNSSMVFKLCSRAQRESQAARFINFSSTTVFLYSQYIRAFPFFLLPSLL